MSHFVLPQLEFVPTPRLLVHERHDDSRTLPLIKRIRASGVWRNPPIVAPLQDRSNRYMVLDGANRVTSLRAMGYPDALVQVVKPNDPGLNLQNWNHVIWELNSERFLKALYAIEGIQLVETEPAHAPLPDLYGDCGLSVIYITEPGNSAADLCLTVCVGEHEIVRRVELLNAIVDSYRERGRLDRTNATELRPLKPIYPTLGGLVIFPNFAIGDVLRLAGQGHLLPTGITRFTISPRALHLNYPLDELESADPIEEKNRRLERWIQERLAHKGMRFYAEATVLFDE